VIISQISSRKHVLKEYHARVLFAQLDVSSSCCRRRTDALYSLLSFRRAFRPHRLLAASNQHLLPRLRVFRVILPLAFIIARIHDGYRGVSRARVVRCRRGKSSTGNQTSLCAVGGPFEDPAFHILIRLAGQYVRIYAGSPFPLLDFIRRGICRGRSRMVQRSRPALSSLIRLRAFAFRVNPLSDTPRLISIFEIYETRA